MTTPSDDRSPAAKAYQWATRIMVVCVEMVLPVLGGYWIDQKLGTVIVFMLIGLAVGCTAGTLHLMRMIAAENRREHAPGKKSYDDRGN